jgi:peptidyl-prolyl cis-trans isomerase SurA
MESQVINSRQMLIAACCVLSMMNAAAYADVSKAPKSIDRIIAVVNDDVITASELDKELSAIKQQLRAQNTTLPAAETLRAQVLDRVVLKRLQLQLAGVNHVKIDDEALNRTILNIATQNKLSLSEFRNVLDGDGVNFEDYRENIRIELTLAQLRQRQVTNRIVVTDQEVDEFLETQAVQGTVTDEFRLSHILIVVPDAATVEQLDTAQKKAAGVLAALRGGADFAQTALSVSGGAQALQGGDLGWRKLGQLPTLFSNLVTTLKVGDLSALIRSPSGFHLIKLVDKRKSDEHHLVTQTRARHILIRTSELVSSDDARRKLEQLKQRIGAGDDFANMARSHSEDSATSVNGGSVGWVSPGDLVPAFEEVMDQLKLNQVSAPFRTQFGWHIVQVLERRDYDNTAELKKTRARDEIRQRKIEEETQIWLRQMRDEAFVELRP